MGSLCCVAARPHVSSTGSREWSNEPFWRTNSSFSPVLSRTWDRQYQSEGLSLGSNGNGRLPCYASSLSSNSKESGSWVRGDQVIDHHYSGSDGEVSYFSSPSESFQNQHLFPPSVQGVSINEYVRESAHVPRTLSQSAEGTAGAPFSIGSVSSRSDGSEFETISKTHLPSHHRNFSSCCSFMSKPIHPLSLTDTTAEPVDARNSNLKSDEALTELRPPSLLDFGCPQRDSAQQSSASTSSMDFTDVSESLEPESFGVPQGSRCGLCEKLLSQKSPWGSRRIVQSRDMPVAGVLSCGHVYHAECLDRTTPKALRHEPPCPLCEKPEDYATEQWNVSRLKNVCPRLRLVGEEGPSRVWSCGQVGDSVEGAVLGSKSSSLLSRNRSRLKRHLLLKGNLGRGQLDSRSGLCLAKLPHEGVGPLTMEMGPIS